MKTMLNLHGLRTGAVFMYIQPRARKYDEDRRKTAGVRARTDMKSEVVVNDDFY